MKEKTGHSKMQEAQTVLKHRAVENFEISRLPMMIFGTYMIFISITCFFLTLYFKDILGFSGNQIGMLYSIQAVTGMLAALPAGIGLDRISSRTIAVAGLLLQGGSFIFLGLGVCPVPDDPRHWGRMHAADFLFRDRQAVSCGTPGG
jgi:MFS family permease